MLALLWGIPDSAGGKELTCQYRKHKRGGLEPWVGKIPWRRSWQPTPVFLPGESPRTEEPGGLQSTGLLRVRHNWSDIIHMQHHLSEAVFRRKMHRYFSRYLMGCQSILVFPDGALCKNGTLKFFNIFIFNWRVIALQCCVDFCNTSTWISHRYTHVPSFLNLPPLSTHPTPLGCHGASG